MSRQGRKAIIVTTVYTLCEKIFCEKKPTFEICGCLEGCTFNAGESGGIVKWTLGHVVVAASEQTDLASLSDRHALTVFYFCTIYILPLLVLDIHDTCAFWVNKRI